MSVIELQSKEWFYITGRGTAYIFDGTDKVPRLELLRDTVVSIDGAEYYVIGIERRGGSYIGHGGNFSLLVKPVPNE